jgi:hypothetical protein
MERTPWFRLLTPPVRCGAYEVQERSGLIWYSRWDGSKWFLTSNSPMQAMESSDKSDDMYDGRVTAWRGLAEPPNTQVPT